MRDGTTKGVTEFEEFDEVIKKLLSVPRDELKKREKAWRKKGTKKEPGCPRSRFWDLGYRALALAAIRQKLSDAR